MASGNHSIDAQGAATKKNPLLKVLSVLIFLVLCFAVFFYANTAIGFKGSGQNKGAYNAFEDLEQNTTDVVLLGSSATSRYFIPSLAYNDEGFSSFVIAPAGTPAIFMDNLMEYVQKTQNPKVFVIELRNVLDGYNAVDEASVRTTVDSMKFYSADRIGMIDEALEVMGEHAEEGSYDDSALDYYLPIVKYHTRLTSTAKREAITADELLLKLPYNETQGFQCGSVTLTQVPQDTPHYETTSCELDADIKEILDEIMDYADGIDAQVLFTFSPYVQTAEQSQMSNAVTDYVKSRGYDCLNSNSDELTQEMGIDWSTDMYNWHHFNYLGAEKYTKFLTKYLKEHYDLEDHRGDATYSSWEEGYKTYEDFVSDGIKHVEKNNVADEE